WDLLPVLADASKDPHTAIEVAGALAETEARSDAEQTLRIAGIGKKRLEESVLPEKDRIEWQNNADYALAQAYLRLDQFGSLDAGREAEILLLRLQSASALSGNPVKDLALLRQRQGRSAEALSLIEAAIEQWPDNSSLYAIRMSLALSQGDKEALSRMASIA